MRAAVLLVAGAVALAGDVRAQGSIVGTVTDSAGQPLTNAEVILLTLSRHARTNASGRFVFPGLKAATYEVRARRLGYIPEQGFVRVPKNDSVVVTFALIARPVVLDTVNVSASCPRFQLAGFECRKRKGKGVFIDEETLDTAHVRFVYDLFRSIPGFRVWPNGRVEPMTGWRCMTTIANGNKVSLQNPLPRWPDELLGLEIYANPNDIPPEYSQYSWIPARGRQPPKRCSLSNYWTSIRPRPR